MKIVRIVLAVCFGAGLVSCSPKPQEIVIGKWQQIGGSPPPFGVRVQVSEPGVMTFDFRPDGIVITQGGVEVSATKVDGKVEKQGGSQPITNHYSFVDDHTLRIAFAKGLRFEGREATFKISASRNELVLTETTSSGLQWEDGGGVLTLQRVK
jgi:hypothetical protein